MIPNITSGRPVSGARTSRFAFVLVAIAWLTTPAMAQQYRPDYPQTLDPAPETAPAVTPGIRESDVSRVAGNYAASNHPSVLLLVGRTLGAQTSEWQADTRDVSTNLQQAFQGRSSSTSRQTGTRQTEDRQPVVINRTPGLLDFQRGLERYVDRAGIRTLHYDAAVRRAQQDNELAGRLSREGDLRKNEADAVLGYAEMLLELTVADVQQLYGVDVESFRVRLTRVDTTETLARTITTPDQAIVVERAWRAGSGGYRESENVRLTYEQLGYDTAHSLFSKALAEPLHFGSASAIGRKQPAPPPTRPGVRKPRLKDNR